MANAGYPDDDGSRSPSGQHDLGRQRESCYDMLSIARPGLVSDQPVRTDVANIQTTSNGDEFLAKPVYPVDGDSNQAGMFVPAAYPSYTQAK